MKLNDITSLEYDDLVESISSREIERHVSNILEKHVNDYRIRKDNEQDVPKLNTVLKRAINEIISDYDIDLPVKVSVRNQRNKLYAEISVSVHKVEQKAIGLNANFIIDPNRLSEEGVLKKLRRIVTHEMIHVVQNIRGNYQSSVSSVNRGTHRQEELSYKDYLADDKEIEAYAVNAAQELRDQFVNPTKLRQYLRQTDLIKKLGNSNMSPSFTNYFDEFYGSDDKRDQKVWKLFIKRFLHHISELMEE